MLRTRLFLLLSRISMKSARCNPINSGIKKAQIKELTCESVQRPLLISWKTRIWRKKGTKHSHKKPNTIRRLVVDFQEVQVVIRAILVTTKVIKILINPLKTRISHQLQITRTNQWSNPHNISNKLNLRNSISNQRSSTSNRLNLPSNISNRRSNINSLLPYKQPLLLRSHPLPQVMRHLQHLPIIRINSSLLLQRNNQYNSL